VTAAATPPFVDRVALLIADFQHAMDSNAPISNALMTELRDVLASGTAAHTECDAMKAKVMAYETSAAKLAKDVQADVTGLTASGA
jgi:hypothetical protein